MKSILVFKHMPSQNPGIFRDLAPRAGVCFQEIDLHAGDAIPEPGDFDALWVMGGSMNAWDEPEFPWLIDEKLVIRRAIRELRMPYFGVCLGHQLAADALGGEVRPANRPELGIVPITPTGAGVDHPLLAGLPAAPGWVNAHLTEVVHVPEGAAVLAASEACANHVMTLGELAYSVQFHPEVCSHTVENWLKIPGIPETMRTRLGEQGYRHFQSSIAEQLPALGAAATRLFFNWTALAFDR